MYTEIVASLICVVILVFFVIYVQTYYSRMLKSQSLAEKQVKDTAIARTLDKFFEESEKASKVVKMAEMERIKKEMEQKIAIKSEARIIKAEEQLKQTPNELEQIEEGGKMFLSFAEGMRSAMPATDEERMKDMNDLMDAVKALEQLDKEQYKIAPTEEDSLGKGMLYDSISRKLTKIIKARLLTNFPFYQAEKLENFAFDEIKQLEHEDYMETLKMMKTIGSLVKDLIEINPQVNLIVFSKDPIKLSQSEKVVFSFAAEEDIVTTARLEKRTLWKPAYIEQTLKAIEKRGWLQVKDNNIIITGLITPEERQQRQAKLDNTKKKQEEKEQQEKAKLQEMQQNQAEIERQKQFEAQERVKQQQEKLLEEARIKAEQEAEARKKQIEAMAEKEESERQAKIRSMPKPSVKVLPLPSASKPVTVQPLPTPAAMNPEAVKMAEEAKALSDNLKQKTSKELPKTASIQTPAPGQTSKPAIVQPQTNAPIVNPNPTNLVDQISTNKNTPKVLTQTGSGDDMEDLQAAIEKMQAAQKNADQPAASKPEVKEPTKAASTTTNLSDFFSDAGSEEVDSEMTKNDMIANEVIAFLESQSIPTGGIIRLDMILKVLNMKSYPNLKKIELLEIIDQLKENQIILDTILVSGTEIYVFDQNVSIDEEMKQLIKQFVVNEMMSEDDIKDALDWDDAKVKRVVKRFMDQKLMGKNKDGNLFLPGCLPPN